MTERTLRELFDYSRGSLPSDGSPASQVAEDELRRGLNTLAPNPVLKQTHWGTLACVHSMAAVGCLAYL